ncbi:MAG: hypothetical protein O7J95_08510, partial [Planctomycetota bacterium]|nr:hypothetical protein [Planctomycetota bacterium]
MKTREFAGNFRNAAGVRFRGFGLRVLLPRVGVLGTGHCSYLAAHTEGWVMKRLLGAVLVLGLAIGHGLPGARAGEPEVHAGP